MDVFGLSKSGFTLIRNLLQGRIAGGAQAAEELAESLHNLPEPGNEFLHNLTIDHLKNFVRKYPDLAKYIEPYVKI